MWNELASLLAPTHNFEVPVRLAWGLGAHRQLPMHAKAAGATICLLITDQTVAELPLTKQVIDSLEQEGLAVAVFRSSVGEPTSAMVQQAVEFAAAHEPSAMVIGLGGGSVLDQAKVAAAMVGNEGPFQQYCGRERLPAAGMHLVLCPTTAGTGSEASKNAIFVDASGTKKVISSRHLLAGLAVVDPLLTLSLPPRPTASTGMDALSHAVEALLSRQCNPVIEGIALTAIRLVHENLARAFCNGQELKARTNMGIAAMLGGMCLNAGVVLGHSIAYTLGHFDLPHGLGCGMALPYVMSFNAPAVPERIEHIALALGAAPGSAALERYAVEEVVRMARVLQLPVALSEVGIGKEALPSLAEECYAKYPRPGNARSYCKADITHLYERLWSGEFHL